MPTTIGRFSGRPRPSRWCARAAPATSVGAGHAYTLVQADAGGANYSKLEQGASLNSIFGQSYFGAFQFFTDTTVMRTHDTIRHAVTFRNNDFGIAYNGGNLQIGHGRQRARRHDCCVSATASPATVPPRMANSGSWRSSARRGPHPSSRRSRTRASRRSRPATASWTAPAAPACPWSFARLAKRTIRNGGAGGSTLAARVSVATPLIAARPQAIFLHWDGKSNSYNADIAVDQANYTAMVNAVLAGGHSKFILFAR